MRDTSDEQWMRQALELADGAAQAGEVPVGALLVRDDRVLGRGGNATIGSGDPTAHAEILALRDAAQRQDNYRLPGTTLYVTLEPCMMCAGAMVHARVERLVFGAFEPKAGVVTSNAALLDAPWLNHKVEITGGVLAKECGERLQRFFRARR